MIRSVLKSAAVIAGFVFLGSSVTYDSANLVRFDRKTGKRTKVLTGFASLPNGLVAGPDGALYTSNWGVSFAADDGEVLRIVP
jgi:hypothetical protein